MRLFVGLLVMVLLSLAQEPAPFRVSTNLVPVTCVLTGRDGRSVLGMDERDFALLDNGKPREIQYFWRDREAPLTVGLIVDVSGSQVGLL